MPNARALHIKNKADNKMTLKHCQCQELVPENMLSRAQKEKKKKEKRSEQNSQMSCVFRTLLFTHPRVRERDADPRLCHDLSQLSL